MMRSCFIPLFTALSLAGQAQDMSADSLWQVWNDKSNLDTARLQALHDLASSVAYTQPDSAGYFARLGHDFAKATGHGKYVAIALNLEALSLALRGDQAGAVQRFTEAAEQFAVLNERTMQADALNNVGLVRSEMGEKAQALEALLSSLRIAEDAKDSTRIARVVLNIGIVYYDVGDTSRALECYERALSMASRKKKWTLVAHALNNIAIIRKAEGDTAQARAMLERSIALCDSLEIGHQLIISLGNLADLHWERGNVPLAVSIYQRGYELAEELDDPDNMAFCLLHIGEDQRNRGDSKTALGTLTRAFGLAEGTGSVRILRDASFQLYALHKADGRPADALKMHELYMTMKDSTTSEKTRHDVMGQRFQYEFEKKEALLHAEQEKKDAVAAEELRRRKLQRNTFIGGFGLMVLLAGVFFTQRNRISKEKRRSDELLLNILPEEVAEELKAKGEADAVQIDHVTVLFTDFKGFTALSETLSPKELVRDLNECFSGFDRITSKYGIEKIKTIGDAYMAAGGLPTPNTTHAADVINAALEMRDFIAEGKARKIAAGLPYFEVRIGVHTGPVVAGIVGVKKFQYDIWGDTVNTASRMESSGEVGQVNISEATYALVKEVRKANGDGRMENENGGPSHSPFTSDHSPAFVFTPRGKVQAKGKGELEMFFVDRTA